MSDAIQFSKTIEPESAQPTKVMTEHYFQFLANSDLFASDKLGAVEKVLRLYEDLFKIRRRLKNLEQAFLQFKKQNKKDFADNEELADKFQTKFDSVQSSLAKFDDSEDCLRQLDFLSEELQLDTEPCGLDLDKLKDLIAQSWTEKEKTEKKIQKLERENADRVKITIPKEKDWFEKPLGGLTSADPIKRSLFKEAEAVCQSNGAQLPPLGIVSQQRDFFIQEITEDGACLWTNDPATVWNLTEEDTIEVQGKHEAGCYVTCARKVQSQ